MVRHDTVCSSRNAAFLRSLAMSAVGTCSMASTWPDRSAAVRTGSLGRIRSVSLSHGRRPPQYSSWRASSMRLPRAKRTSLYGTGADRRLAAVEILARRLRRRLLRHDHHFREVLQQRAVGRRGLEPHGVAVHDLLCDDRPHVGLEAAGAAGDGERALEREDDVLGGQLGAVVELHALAQREFPGEGIGRAPGRNPGNGAAALVGLDQRIEHVRAAR